MVKLLKTFFLTSLLIMTASQAEAGRDLFDAARNNDLETLRAAVAEKADLNARGARDVTPLMHAVAFGSPEAVRILIEAGADVNAHDGFGATALVWAAGDTAKTRMLVEHGADVNARTTNGRTPLMVAAHDGNIATVRLLLDKGANLKAADEQGDTPLLLAAYGNSTDTVKLLLERGADPNDTNKAGFTPLLNATANGNVAAMRMLIDKGARVNVANTFGGMVKFGEIALKQLTPLMMAVPTGGVPAVRMLLEAGAEVNARDSRGMTALMLAAGSEKQDVAVARMLLAKGADVNVRSTVGETALDWAKKYGNPQMIATLEKAGAQEGSPAAEITVPRRSGRTNVLQAIERSERLLQRSGAEFFRQSGCASCHHHASMQMATAAARVAGVRVDETAAAESVKQTIANWELFQPGLLERLDGPAAPDIQMFAALGLAAEKQPASLVTDSIAVNIAARQQLDGGWNLGGMSRAPIEEGNIARTAISLRALQVYGTPGRKEEFDGRIAKARRYLEKAEPETTDDFVWRVVGLYWSGADLSKVARAAEALRKLQREDGGWAGNKHLASDAYATGSALWALYTAGAMNPADEPYQRGVRFLLATQFDDGSWYVRSRAPKFQPYFESGFPFGHDQWISAAATAWATVALSPAAALTVTEAGPPAYSRSGAGGGE